MKKFLVDFIFLATLLFTGVAAYAANTARQTLDKAAAKVNISKGVSVTFTISGASLGTQSGSVAIKGNKFNARTKNTIVWFDGKTQWLYNKKNQEVNISTPKNAQLASMNPYFFLTVYKKGYKLNQTATANGYNVHVYGGKNGIKEMYIQTDRKYNIKKIKLKQEGQWLSIIINDFTHKSISDSAFRFDFRDYPKAEVIDLR